jgi:hypothetical protein
MAKEQLLLLFPVQRHLLRPLLRQTEGPKALLVAVQPLKSLLSSQFCQMPETERLASQMQMA